MPSACLANSDTHGQQCWRSATQAHLPAAATVAIAVLLPRPLAALLALHASWQALHACPWPLAACKAAEGCGAATLRELLLLLVGLVLLMLWLQVRVLLLLVQSRPCWLLPRQAESGLLGPVLSCMGAGRGLSGARPKQVLWQRLASAEGACGTCGGA